MGSINKFCPHCGSHDIYEIKYEKINLEHELIEIEHYYECSDCQSAWEPHNDRSNI